MMTKNWWESKTIWVNLVAFFIAVLGAALDTDLVRATPQAVYIATDALSGLNLVLRFLTHKPIGGTGL